MKVLRDASLVIGAIALAASGVGLVAGPAAVAASSTLQTIATVAKVASFAAAATGLAAGLLAKKPSSVSPFAWKADPQAGIPYAIGQCYLGGNIVYRETYGKDNKYQTLVTVLSGAGPVQSIDTLYVDNVERSVSGQEVNIPDQGFLYVNQQLGQMPEAQNLLCAPIDPYAWTAQCKLSGYAAYIATLVYAAKGKHTMTTTPQLGWFGKWVKVYDPRKDSTYPGGNGSHRWADPADTAAHDAARLTWEWSANPYLHALHWLLGRWERDPSVSGSTYQRVIGVGVSIDDIITSQYVEGANVADANGWTAHGSWTSTDDAFDVLTNILQAGGGVPLQLGALIGCMINTPRVSLATLTQDDLAGDYSIQTMQPRKDRINAIRPRYVGKQSVTTQDSDENLITSVTWSVVSAKPIIIDDYVAFDGEVRQKEVTYSLVQGDGDSGNAPNQVAQLARYDIENAREFGPIQLELKLRWYGYRPGDVITANLPELGLNGQDIMILSRTLNPSTGTVSITARSETQGKHAYALGQTTVAPATPSVNGPALLPVPGQSAWTLTGGEMTSGNGTTKPVLQVIGSADSDVIDAVVFQYRTSQTADAAPGPWKDAGSYTPAIELLDITSVEDQTAYDVSVAYRKGSGTGTALILGPAVAGQTSVPYETGVTGEKPPVDATAGAPAGSLVGDRLAEQVVSDLDVNAAGIVAQALRQDDAQTLLNSLVYQADQPALTIIETFKNQIMTSVSAIATLANLLAALSPDGTAAIFNVSTVQSGVIPGQTMGQLLTGLSAANGANSAQITSLLEVLVGPTGSQARAVLKVDANGNIAGIALTASSDEISRIGLVAGATVIAGTDGTLLAEFLEQDGQAYIPNLLVDTIKPGSVTSSARQVGAGSFTGNGAWQSLASITLNLNKDADVDVLFNAGQGYNNGVKDWGLRLSLDGTVVKNFAYGGGRTGTTEILNLFRSAVPLTAGTTHTLLVEWAADDASVKVDQVDLSCVWRFA